MVTVESMGVKGFRALTAARPTKFEDGEVENLEVIMKWTAVVKLKIHDGVVCSKIKIWKERTKLRNMWVAKFRNSRYLVWTRNAATTEMTRVSGRYVIQGHSKSLTLRMGNGARVFLPQPTMAMGSVVSSLSGVRGGAPTENGFQCFSKRHRTPVVETFVVN